MLSQVETSAGAKLGTSLSAFPLGASLRRRIVEVYFAQEELLRAPTGRARAAGRPRRLPLIDDLQEAGSSSVNLRRGPRSRLIWSFSGALPAAPAGRPATRYALRVLGASIRMPEPEVQTRNARDGRRWPRGRCGSTSGAESITTVSQGEPRRTGPDLHECHAAISTSAPELRAGPLLPGHGRHSAYSCLPRHEPRHVRSVQLGGRRLRSTAAPPGGRAPRRSGAWRRGSR
jgi:hypothetical protein